MTRRLSPTLTLVLSLAAAIPGRAETDDLERSVALMAKIGSATSPSFSPDGKTIAYVTNLGGLPQVWTVDAAGGYPQLVTAFDDAVGSVQWSPDGAWLAFTLAPGGGMNEQVYLVRPDGTGLKRLTDGGKETNRLGPWSHDGSAPRARLERAQRRRDRLLRLRRRRRDAAPRHAEPRHRRVRRPDARQEARAPQPPRQPRRQQPLLSSTSRPARRRC